MAFDCFKVLLLRGMAIWPNLVFMFLAYDFSIFCFKTHSCALVSILFCDTL